MGVVEVLACIVLIATELGNVGANFWTTNVFAGGWCGIIMIAHFISLFVTGCCSPGPASAFRAVVITIIALVACATMISFDAVFIAQPTTCILTPSCSTNAASTSMFSYYFQTAFFTLFRSLSPFSSYSQTQAKFLFQTIQLGVGSLCFVLCIIYLIIYYVTKSKALKTVGPSPQESGPYAPQPGPAYRQTQRQTQANPGELPWNQNRRY